MPPFENLLAALLVLLPSFAALAVALNLKRQERLLADTPTSKALGVFIGEVEVSGVCVSQYPFTSHLTDTPCVYYRWKVVEHWVRGSGNSRYSGEDVVASGGQASEFYLKDETGFIWVNPVGAKIEPCVILKKLANKTSPLYYAKGPLTDVEGSKGLRTFTEYALTVGMKVFIRGRASERPDVVAAQIAHDEREDIFIISYRGERSISARMDWRARSLDFTGAFAAVNAALVAFAGLGPVLAVYAGFLAMVFDDDHPVKMFGLGLSAVGPYIPLGLLIGVSLYLLMRAVGWARMAFNSMVGLRNRVAQAYSLIDVQLKRRTDLIERFVACVQGFREHETAVQALVTAMRAQAGGSSLKALAPGILAVIESYPEIRAQALFNDLSKQLIETEDRIALARGYHNNIATFYNTRLETIPDRYLAGLVKMKPAALFEAEGFTHHPATVMF